MDPNDSVDVPWDYNRKCVKDSRWYLAAFVQLARRFSSARNVIVLLMYANRHVGNIPTLNHIMSRMERPELNQTRKTRTVYSKIYLFQRFLHM